MEKSSRIVGGTEVSPANKYPWVVALLHSDGYLFCGGTLVASKYVVTAASCMTYVETVDNIKVITIQH